MPETMLSASPDSRSLAQQSTLAKPVFQHAVWWVLLSGLVGLTALSAWHLAYQTFRPEPIHIAGLTIDRLSAALTLLVALVGTVTFRFSMRYLDGEAGQGRFLGWLFFSVIAAYLLMLSTHLLVLFLAWSFTSYGLHRLLTHYQSRTEAVRSARKKFLISRLGDVALLAAIGLVWFEAGTLDLTEYLGKLDIAQTTTTAAGLLVVVAALTKSAQFPFHSWLPETMESPTPVSALMHAGIINAGGALLLRFAPLIAAVPAALFLLSLVGTLTAALGMLAMWAQVKVKRTLAWSTVSQMGFMMVQCGLGAFPAALLHILGHGCYKAWSFLRSGEVPAPVAEAQPTSPAVNLGWIAVGSMVAMPVMAAAAWLTGFSPLHSPGEMALAFVVALSVGQLWAALLGPGVKRVALVTAISLALVVPTLAFGLYQVAEGFLEPIIGVRATPTGQAAVWAWWTAGVPVVALVALTVLHRLLPVLVRTRAGRAFFVHALYGFYFGALADRLVGRVWPVVPNQAGRS